MFNGYLEYGGAEIINAARTYAYVRNSIPQLDIQPCANCDDLAAILGDKEYESPLVDGPDWFDAGNVDTWDFYGLYPLSLEGFEDGTTEATVTQLMTDGAVTSVPRRAGREIRVTGLMIAGTDAGLAAGMVWLRSALLGSGCRNDLRCAGDHLCYFSACPPVCTDSPDWPGDDPEPIHTPHPTSFNGGRSVRHHLPPRSCETGLVVEPIHQCTFNYERNLYDVVLLDGPRITAEYPSECAHMVRVEFTMMAGCPSPISTATWVIGPGTPLPASSIIPEVSCTDDGRVTTRENVAVNPAARAAPGWTAPAGPYTLTRGNDEIPFPGVQSVRVERTTTAPAETEFARVEQLGGGAAPAAKIPAGALRVMQGWQYTASTYAWASVAANGVIAGRFYDSAGKALSGTFTGPANVLPAGGWGRVSARFTPPANARYVVLSGSLRRQTGNAQAGDYGYFSAALVELGGATQTWFDGASADTEEQDFRWTGTANASSSTASVIVDTNPIIIDPDCAAIPDPPRPPAIDDSCLDDTDQWRRYQVQIDADIIPVWSDALPIMALTVGPTAVRQVRIRFYPNPFGFDLDQLEACNFCGEYVVSYIPPNSTLTVDAVRREASVESAGGLVRAASHLLYSSDGGPMVWPALTCGVTYTMTIDVVPDTITDMAVKLCIAGRE